MVTKINYSKDAVESIRREDTSQIVELAVECFRNDHYFINQYSTKVSDITSLLRTDFEFAIDYCIKEKTAFGIKVDGHFISFFLLLDYKKLINQDKMAFQKIFGIDINIDFENSSKENEQVAFTTQNKIQKLTSRFNLRLMYLLSIGVDVKFRRMGIASGLIDFVLNKFPDYYFIGDVSNQNSLNIYRKRGFLVEEINSDYFLINNVINDEGELQWLLK